MYVIGAIELIILLLFVAGYKKKYTYGVVLALHTVSTLSSFKQYLAPFYGPNLLFFAAWPMLAACFALFILRDQDKIWSVD
jgi:putative oxidoreductase